ncbi:cis-3-hydroxy-L-proline dehydratase [Brucella cytisi]|uniref:cis-3-hydroxy-L-proline dehydratase n=1 Tax=Brucella cytisi TaxID=407152 RepID=UPI0035D74C42
MLRVEESSFSGIAYVDGMACGEVIASELELSFWGGVDAATGEIIDRHHPLSGKFLAEKILAIPGGRGSCSGSGVLLELILNGNAPKAMLFEREEDILTLGVIVADELFGKSIPVVTLAPGDFKQILEAKFVRIEGGEVTCSNELRASHVRHPGFDFAANIFGEVALTDRDEALLSGVRGKAAQVAMRVITRMARLQGARQLIDVAQVHVDGCIYTGPGSLLFAERFRELGGHVVVPTTLNSISVDHKRWRAQGIDPSFGEPAAKLGDVYTDMGARPTFTCAPYLLESAPKFGEQIAWAESNAVVFGNSVLGARTMKYPDFLDFCIALTGRAPLAGPHVDTNRKARLCVEITDVVDVDDSFYPLLGYWIGSLAGNQVPVIVGLARVQPSIDALKAFGAAFATVSSAPMFHIQGVTPEAAELSDVVPHELRIETVRIKPSALRVAWEELNSAADSTVNLVSLGNPHFSFEEIERFAALCRGRKKNSDVAVVITTSRSTYARANKAGLISELESFGTKFLTDTCWCMVSDPVIPPTAKAIMTNSGKYAHYGPGLTGRQFHFGSLAACAEAAFSGHNRTVAPRWMSDRKTGAAEH